MRSILNRRVNRQTRTVIETARDDFLGWITICVDHGYVCEHPTRALAIGWAAEPRVWCEGCQRVVDQRST
jgi:hypothetical protein